MNTVIPRTVCTTLTSATPTNTTHTSIPPTTTTSTSATPTNTTGTNQDTPTTPTSATPTNTTRTRTKNDGHDHDDHDGHDHHDHDGHDDHGHGHDGHDGHDHHGHSHDYTDVNRRSLVIALILIGGFMIAEVIGGILSGSLALLSDAGHMITDTAAIALALVAQRMAQRDASSERTFGYRRAEVLAAMLNALSLWLIAAWVFFEAYHRMRDVPDVESGIPLIVGVLGLLVNIAAAWVLHRTAEHSMNVEGAFRHVMADRMGSVGVVISGIVILTLGWTIVDPILSILIGLLILGSSWNLTVKMFHVLMEAVPENVDVYALCDELEEQPGVTLVHAYTYGSGHDDTHVHRPRPGRSRGATSASATSPSRPRLYRVTSAT